MKTNTVISYINRLHKKLGTHKAVAKKLGISKRYVIYLKTGERIPSDHLRKLIKLSLK